MWPEMLAWTHANLLHQVRYPALAFGQLEHDP